jgi:hypothetical protein
MSAYFTAIDTNDGLIHVLTKDRWLAFVPMPHTSVVPSRAASLRGLGTLIKWSTGDTAELAALHEEIVDLVKQTGASGLADIRETVKMAARVAAMFHSQFQITL